MQVTTASAHHWRAAALLEHADPEHFGRRQEVRIGNADGETFSVTEDIRDAALVSDKHARTLATGAAAAGGGSDLRAGDASGAGLSGPPLGGASGAADAD